VSNLKKRQNEKKGWPLSYLETSKLEEREEKSPVEQSSYRRKGGNYIYFNELMVGGEEPFYYGISKSKETATPRLRLHYFPLKKGGQRKERSEKHL